MPVALDSTVPAVEAASELGTYTEAQLDWIMNMMELSQDARLELALSDNPAELEESKAWAMWILRMARWVRR